jgi:hypothetical protein
VHTCTLILTLSEGKGKEKVRLQRLGIALKPSDEVEDSQVKKRKARQERFQAFGVSL